MTVTCFVDTNVFVYFRDQSEPEKQPQAAEWLHRLWSTRSGRVSMQVLTEYYVTVTRKLVPGVDKASARADVRNLMRWNPVKTDGTLLEMAWQIQDDHGVSWWDALIVAAAQQLSCRYLLSEDLQHGYSFPATDVINPFRHHPQEILE